MLLQTKAMQSSSVVTGVLAAFVSLPGILAGHLLQQGQHGAALKVALCNLLVVLLASAIMVQRKQE